MSTPPVRRYWLSDIQVEIIIAALEIVQPREEQASRERDIALAYLRTRMETEAPSPMP